MALKRTHGSIFTYGILSMRSIVPSSTASYHFIVERFYSYSTSKPTSQYSPQFYPNLSLHKYSDWICKWRVVAVPRDWGVRC